MVTRGQDGGRIWQQSSSVRWRSRLVNVVAEAGMVARSSTAGDGVRVVTTMELRECRL